MKNILATTLFILLCCYGKCQSPETNIVMTLAGSAVDEGHYKPVAYFTFYEFSEKCKLQRLSSAKLNKRTRESVRLLPADKRVIAHIYYGDLRTRYGRSTSDYIVFQPQAKQRYSIEVVVEGDAVSVRVFSKEPESQEKREIQFLRGYEHVNCVNEL